MWCVQGCEFCFDDGNLPKSLNIEYCWPPFAICLGCSVFLPSNIGSLFHNIACRPFRSISWWYFWCLCRTSKPKATTPVLINH